MLTDEAVRMLSLMAHKFGYKLSYVEPMDREDCEAFAVLDLLLYWKGYNPEKSQNAFAYYTQIIKNGYAKGWKKLHGQMPNSTRISLSYHTLYNL